MTLFEDEYISIVNKVFPVNKVFIYGPMQKGLQNHSILANNGAEFVGPAELHEAVVMHDLGKYPSIVFNNSKDSELTVVFGEVYKITEIGFKMLDRLEGYPKFYTRKKCYVRLSCLQNEKEEDNFIHAWVYHLSQEKASIMSRGLVDKSWADHSNNIQLQQNANRIKRPK